jgi:signal transduction histidine kinase
LPDHRDQLLAAQADERRRVAEALHDTPVQILAVASMRLDLLAAALDTPDAPVRLEEVREAIHDALHSMRSIIFAMHPPSLERNGLAEALDELAHRLFDPTPIALTVDVRFEPQPSLGTASAAVQLACDGFTNVLTSGEPSAVRCIGRTEDGGVRVTIADDGARASSATLEPASRYAEAAGGWLRVDDSPDGTTFDCWLPH